MKKRINPDHVNKSDITELAQLKESEERFRNTFEQAAVGIAHVRLDGNFIRINQKFCDIVRYSQQEMLNLTFQDITHPDDLATGLSNLQMFLAQDIDIYSMEKRYFRNNRTIVWINLTVSLVRHKTGYPKYFIAVVGDITTSKETEERCKLLIEQAPDALRNSSNKKADQSFSNKEKNGKSF